jgi:hypothetical protein
MKEESKLPKIKQLVWEEWKGSLKQHSVHPKDKYNYFYCVDTPINRYVIAHESIVDEKTNVDLFLSGAYGKHERIGINMTMKEAEAKVQEHYEQMIKSNYE